MKNLALILLFLTISFSLSDDPTPAEETRNCSDEDLGDATFEIC